MIDCITTGMFVLLVELTGIAVFTGALYIYWKTLTKNSNSHR